MDCSLPGCFVLGIFQARILEWVAISSSRDLPDAVIEPASPALQADSLSNGPLGKSPNVEVTAKASLEVKRRFGEMLMCCLSNPILKRWWQIHRVWEVRWSPTLPSRWLACSRHGLARSSTLKWNHIFFITSLHGSMSFLISMGTVIGWMWSEQWWDMTPIPSQGTERINLPEQFEGTVEPQIKLTDYLILELCFFNIVVTGACQSFPCKGS